MIVVKMQTKQRQTNLQSILFKILIVPLLSKNKNSDKFAFKNRQDTEKAKDLSPQNYINTIQKHSQNLK